MTVLRDVAAREGVPKSSMVLDNGNGAGGGTGPSPCKNTKRCKSRIDSKKEV